MSRKAVKFLNFYVSDLKIYFKNLLGYRFKNQYLKFSRRKTFNIWNLVKPISVYQGRFRGYFKLNDYLLGYKVGMLTKTRKPFFFRGKKK